MSCFDDKGYVLDDEYVLNEFVRWSIFMRIVSQVVKRLEKIVIKKILIKKIEKDCDNWKRLG